MDGHLISELVLLISADIRANGCTFNEAFAKAISPFQIGEAERERIAHIVKSKVTAKPHKR